MEDSVLLSIRHACQVGDDNSEFDDRLKRHANYVFMTLAQKGVGPDGGFRITDESQTWEEFSEDPQIRDAASEYVGTSVRLRFDPPASSVLLGELKEQVKENEWFLTYYAGPYYKEETDVKE